MLDHDIACRIPFKEILQHLGDAKPPVQSLEDVTRPALNAMVKMRLPSLYRVTQKSEIRVVVRPKDGVDAIRDMA